MAFIFTMKSTGGDTMHRRTPTESSSLPAIDEDRDWFAPLDAPPVPPRALNRPSNTIFGLGDPPKLNFDSTPPEYSQFDSNGVLGPHGEKLADVRKGIANNKHIAKRGGWKRLGIIAIIILLCLIALIVGLVVGLRPKHKSTSTINGGGSSSNSTSGGSGNSGNNGSGNGNGSGGNNGGTNTPSGGASGTVEPDPKNPASNTTFPAGSYRIDTYLSTAATNCTSNPATWMCYPYSTYAQDPSGSAAAYDWIISPVEGTNNFTISSTPNVFSIEFSNISLSLMKEGTDQEYYFFQMNMQKPTKPSSPLGSDNVASTCYFNDTTFHAYLYTKMPKTYPSSNTETNTTAPYSPWPYAVKIEQVTGAGADTPSCTDPSGNSVGDFSVSDLTQLCDCLYLNTGT